MSNNVSETVALLWAQASGDAPEPIWMSALGAVTVVAVPVLCLFIGYVFGGAQ